MAGMNHNTTSSRHPAPADAMLAARLFMQLGGYFMIDSEGRRCLGRIEPVGRTKVCGLSGADWERCIRMMEGLLSALHRDDKAMLFDAFADCVEDPRKPFDFREQL